MNPVTILAAAAITLASTFAAQAHCAAHTKQTMSCATGTTWDDESAACVPETTS